MSGLVVVLAFDTVAAATQARDVLLDAAFDAWFSVAPRPWSNRVRFKLYGEQQNAAAAEIEAAIAAMAGKLGKRIIAEGVETEEQAAMLLEQGCDEMQGFVICRPASAEVVTEFLSREIAQ